MSAFSWRLVAERFYLDEFGSDEFASKILQDNYGIGKPSKMVKNVVEKTHSSFDHSRCLNRLIFTIFEYHPSAIQRVRNVAGHIDDENQG